MILILELWEEKFISFTMLKKKYQVSVSYYHLYIFELWMGIFKTVFTQNGLPLQKMQFKETTPYKAA